MTAEQGFDLFHDTTVIGAVQQWLVEVLDEPL